MRQLHVWEYALLNRRFPENGFRDLKNGNNFFRKHE